MKTFATAFVLLFQRGIHWNCCKSTAPASAHFDTIAISSMCPRRMFLLLSVSSNYHKSGHKKPQLVILLLVLWPLAAEGREGEHASSVWFGESARWWMGIGNTSYDLFYDGGDSLVQLPPLWWGPFLSKTYLTLLLVLRRINRWKLSTLTFLNSKIAKKSWSQNLIMISLTSPLEHGSLYLHRSYCVSR